MWTLTVADSKSLDAFHMKCQRHILGISWHQFVRNEEVAALTGLSSLLDIICRRRSAIFGHIARFGECHPGRPRGRWIDQLRRDNSQPPADLWRQAINRGHSGRATQRSSDYVTTWPDLTWCGSVLWDRNKSGINAMYGDQVNNSLHCEHRLCTRHARRSC